jgi:TonB family protein
MPIVIASGERVGRLRFTGVLARFQDWVLYQAVDEVKGRPVLVRQYNPTNPERAMDALPSAGRHAQSRWNEVLDIQRQRFELARRLVPKPGAAHVALIDHLTDETFFAVMSHPASQDLTADLASVRAPAEPAIQQFLIPIIEVLSGLHRARVLYCGLTPEEILLDRADPGTIGRPVLAGFSNVYHAGGMGPPRPHADDHPAWAPEFHNRQARLAPAADVYALAALTYTMMAGAPPKSAIERQRGIEHTPASEIGGSYSGALCRAVDHGLRLDPAARLQSVDAFREIAMPGVGFVLRPARRRPRPAPVAPNRDNGAARPVSVAPNQARGAERPAALPPDQDLGAPQLASAAMAAPTMAEAPTSSAPVLVHSSSEPIARMAAPEQDEAAGEPVTLSRMNGSVASALRALKPRSGLLRVASPNGAEPIAQAPFAARPASAATVVDLPTARAPGYKPANDLSAPQAPTALRTAVVALRRQWQPLVAASIILVLAGGLWWLQSTGLLQVHTMSPAPGTLPPPTTAPPSPNQAAPAPPTQHKEPARVDAEAARAIAVPVEPGEGATSIGEAKSPAPLAAKAPSPAVIASYKFELKRLGYYSGPVDGEDGPALRTALAAATVKLAAGVRAFPSQQFLLRLKAAEAPGSDETAPPSEAPDAPNAAAAAQSAPSADEQSHAASDAGTSPNSPGGVRPARPRDVVNPDYPANAMRQGVAGWVEVSYDIDPDGKVHHAHVTSVENVQAAEFFGATALHAVEASTFDPATEDGKPTWSRGEKRRFNFAMQDH